MKRQSIAALCFACVASLGSEAVARQQSALLLTPDQLAMERQTLRIFNSPSFRSRMLETEKLLRDNGQSHSQSGQATLAAANAAMVLHSLEHAVDGDPQRPKILWVDGAGHRSGDLVMPHAGYGFDNPDNVYRIVPIDGQSSYEIAGVRGGRAPAQETFLLYGSIPGDGDGPIDGPIGGIDDRHIVSGPDGAFTVTIDPEPANGRANHIQSKANARILLIRDSLSDWAGQSPNALQVRRVGGPEPLPLKTDSQIAEEGLRLAPKEIAFWLNYGDTAIYNRPVNTVPAPNKRGGGLGLTANGFFSLADDEALIVTVDPKGAKYLGAQLADPWAISVDYVRHTGSLNAAQARPNADGSYSYVIAAHDPGVWNWLDTGGLREGGICIRWQVLPADTAPEAVIRDVRLVKRATLIQSLSAGAPMISVAERRKQLRQRRADYAHRFENP
jgi:hypothetical protein